MAYFAEIFKLSSENQKRVAEHLIEILETLSLHQISFNFSSNYAYLLVLLTLPIWPFLYCYFLFTLLIKSFTLANIGISFSVLLILINDISASIIIKQLLLSSKGRTCFNTCCPCFSLIYLNILIQVLSIITNKITRSFNMVLLGGINNSNRVE